MYVCQLAWMPSMDPSLSVSHLLERKLQEWADLFGGKCHGLYSHLGQDCCGKAVLSSETTPQVLHSPDLYWIYAYHAGGGWTHCSEREGWVSSFLPVSSLFLITCIRWLFQASILQYEAGLRKMNEAFSSIGDYKRQVSDLAPSYQKALDHVTELVECVEQKRQEFIQVCLNPLVLTASTLT